MRFSACAGEVVPAAAAPGPSQMPGQCPSPGTKESSDCIRDPTCVEGAAGPPFGAAPCQLPLATQALPQMATNTIPFAQSYSPVQADGATSALSEFGESYFPEFGRSPEHTSQPSQLPAACAFGGQAQPMPANMPGTPTSFQQSVGMPGMPMQEQTPPGYRSGAVSQAGLKQVEGCGFKTLRFPTSSAFSLNSASSSL